MKAPRRVHTAASDPSRKPALPWVVPTTGPPPGAPGKAPSPRRAGTDHAALHRIVAPKHTSPCLPSGLAKRVVLAVEGVVPRAQCSLALISEPEVRPLQGPRPWGRRSRLQASTFSSVNQEDTLLPPPGGGQSCRPAGPSI